MKLRIYPVGLKVFSRVVVRVKGRSYSVYVAISSSEEGWNTNMGVLLLLLLLLLLLSPPPPSTSSVPPNAGLLHAESFLYVIMDWYTVQYAATFM